MKGVFSTRHESTSVRDEICGDGEIASLRKGREIAFGRLMNDQGIRRLIAATSVANFSAGNVASISTATRPAFIRGQILHSRRLAD
jgi:hypothetical protein